MRRGNSSAHAKRMRVVSLPPEAVRAPTATATVATKRLDRLDRQTEREREWRRRGWVSLLRRLCVADGWTHSTYCEHSLGDLRHGALQTHRAIANR